MSLECLWIKFAAALFANLKSTWGLIVLLNVKLHAKLPGCLYSHVQRDRQINSGANRSDIPIEYKKQAKMNIFRHTER